ncbi:ATP-binding protein [Vibrio alginolyticus]|uniref:AAA family ATPase n=1 Tax=Vibrio TaxID=662 RepID=UPI00146A7CAD|nr:MULTISPECIES: ATP-binding protein [Vibrio]HCH0053477.1 AAA family ATPase [Vibrio parahaemolyticus]MCS0272755.1 ATP-binding protein [Vibrio alginolyticus]MDW2075645.1 ATP-binding protein [Vibrio sp. 1863]MDW2252623.1 ATP-binding protein [Vibrio sp. 1569]MDW2302460.1 ATP-binding protein [Vibrio sp. 1167]
MILKFGFTNFTSFKESVEVNFTFDGKTPKSITNDFKVSTVLGIKGANGSGKTNILRALSFLSNICTMGARTHRFTTSKENSEKPQKISVDSFFDNNDPIEFYIDFEFGGCEYSYELDMQNGAIIRELITKKEKSIRKLIERNYNEITYRQKSYEEFDNFELREDKSIVEMLTQFKFRHDITDLSNVYRFFIQMIFNVNYNGYHDLDLDFAEQTEEFYNKPLKFDFVKQLIKASDSSVHDIKIKVFKDHEGEDLYTPVFVHRCGNEFKELSFAKQSTGTQKLYQTLSAYFLVLSSGGVIALDEFDVHLHALILPLLINLFINPKINKTGAQLIFTSHNTEIIDVLGKYRTYLVNKEDGESYGYRLDEIPGSMIRNDRPITPLYVSGKIGGIPESVDLYLEKLMEDLQNG